MNNNWGSASQLDEVPEDVENEEINQKMQHELGDGKIAMIQ